MLRLCVYNYVRAGDETVEVGAAKRRENETTDQREQVHVYTASLVAQSV